jgi:DNA-binding response OmpR family regulator
MRVLIVEDAQPMADALARGLREQGYAVDIAGDGEAALEHAEINSYDAIVLDVLLPRKDGFAVCRELRRQGQSVPVLMLTARDAVEDRVAGLDAGADDYLIKPFAFKELLARLRALLRRHREVRPLRLCVADLTLDTASQDARRGGRQIRLTAKEYALLEFLMIHAGEVVSRESISEHVWDEHFDPFSNLIEVYIQRLRKKIDEGATDRLIHTRRGAGYFLRDL